MIDKKTLRHVAALAHLKLTPEEEKEFLPQLQEVLKAFDDLKKVDTKGIDPVFHPIPIPFYAREDKESECITQEEALTHTSLQKDGFFKSPKLR